MYLEHGGNDDKAARDYFFSSLTGAVVYGHGQVAMRAICAPSPMKGADEHWLARWRIGL